MKPRQNANPTPATLTHAKHQKCTSFFSKSSMNSWFQRVKHTNIWSPADQCYSGKVLFIKQDEKVSSDPESVTCCSSVWGKQPVLKVTRQLFGSSGPEWIICFISSFETQWQALTLSGECTKCTWVDFSPWKQAKLCIPKPSHALLRLNPPGSLALALSVGLSPTAWEWRRAMWRDTPASWHFVASKAPVTHLNPRRFTESRRLTGSQTLEDTGGLQGGFVATYLPPRYFLFHHHFNRKTGCCVLLFVAPQLETVHIMMITVWF